VAIFGDSIFLIEKCFKKRKNFATKYFYFKNFTKNGKKLSQIIIIIIIINNNNGSPS
jgi:hypothetical protein